jgi:hypothetical protein
MAKGGHMLIRLFPVVLLVLMAACDSLAGPGEREEVGIIAGLAEAAPEIEIPATVQAGEEFSVTIITVWRNGCARMDRTDVEVDGANATITPWDVIRDGAMCSQEPRQFNHTATLSFSEPGTSQVVVRGRASDAGGVTEVQREVTVQ